MPVRALRIAILSWAVLGCSAAVESSSQPLAAPVSTSLQLHIEQGDIEGRSVEGDVRSFLGIPYALPPIGELRWRAPQPHPGWQGTRDAAHWSARCPQAASHGAPNAFEAEDCLYLNVWAPRVASGLPVMVWIHGGGNTDGSASDEGTNGKWLAGRFDVVVVSVNYRLGVLGFFAHPELAAEGGRPGNQGLRDQQLALTWVEHNIAAFGGDPNNVTIFGESAGATDVCLQLAAPASRGLFQRALAESGSCTTRRKFASEASTYATALAERTACPADDALACLRAKPLPDLFTAADALVAQGASFGPIVDGDFIPDQPRNLYDRREIAQVPLLIGSNTDEGTGFVMNIGGLVDDQSYLEALRQRLTAPPDQVAALYPPSAFRDAQNPYQAALARAWGDGRLVCPTLDVAIRTAATGAPVFMYNFDIPLDGPGGAWGAAHATEIAYVFGTAPNFTPEQAFVSQRMQRYWTQFAKTGDPNLPDLQTWPRFGTSADVRLNFGVETSVVNGFRARECEFWREQYGRMF